MVSRNVNYKKEEDKYRMLELERTLYQRYCPNCSTKVFGYRERDGRIKMKCNRCGLVSVITIKNRRHSITEEYLPRYMERLNEIADCI